MATAKDIAREVARAVEQHRRQDVGEDGIITNRKKPRPHGILDMQDMRGAATLFSEFSRGPDASETQLWGVYARVSTETQADDNASIEEQVSEVVEAILQNGHNPRFIAYDSYTGRAASRPGLSELFGRVRQRRLRGIGAWSMDRISRHFYAGAGIIQKAIDLQAPFHVLAGGGSHTLRTTKQEEGDDWVFAAIQLLFADQYYQTLRRTTRRGARAALAEGDVGRQIDSPQDPFFWTELVSKADKSQLVSRPTTDEEKKALKGKTSEVVRVRAGGGHKLRAAYRFLCHAAEIDASSGRDTTEETRRVESALAKGLDAGSPGQLRGRLMRPYTMGYYGHFGVSVFDIPPDQSIAILSNLEYANLNRICERVLEATSRKRLDGMWLEFMADKYGLDRLLLEDDANRRLTLLCQYCNQPMTERARRRRLGRVVQVFECRACDSEEMVGKTPTTMWPPSAVEKKLEWLPIPACPSCGERHQSDEPTPPVPIRASGYSGLVEASKCPSCGVMIWSSHHLNMRKRMEVLQQGRKHVDEAVPRDFVVQSPAVASGQQQRIA